MSLEVLSQSKPKARKDHGCSMCGKLIPKGQIYQSEALSFNGSAYTYKSCWRCVLHALVLSTTGEDYSEGITRNEVRAEAEYYGWKLYVDKIRKAKAKEETK